jgi:hypothetical protein
MTRDEPLFSNLVAHRAYPQAVANCRDPRADSREMLRDVQYIFGALYRARREFAWVANSQLMRRFS